MTTAIRVHHTICPLCEATCGLTISAEERTVIGIRGAAEDVFSHGYICPKGYGLKELDADPDRLRTPMIRRGDEWQAATWDEAFAEIAAHLPAIRAEYGNDAVAAYLGNPNVHDLDLQLYAPVLLRTLRTRNIYSASTLDQMPKQVSAGYMFGGTLTIPIPDVDRTDYFLILGANPLVSNGSLMTAPDMRGRLRAIKARGGQIVVIDPRRTRTAEEATAHHFIRPGTDALFLFALVHTLFAENLARPGALANHLNGMDDVAAVARDFAPETVTAQCGIPAATIRQIARDLAHTERAAVYGRIGTCTQEFGTLASWLVDVLNALTGNLDRPGGAMFPKAAAGAYNASGVSGRGKGFRLGKLTSRVRGLPQVMGEFPTATLADEILTPGDGQIRALITIAGNPALSAPNGDRLAHALAQLDFMVSIDCYLNETTRHAHVILPPPAPLERSHYDLAFSQLAIRNVVRYAPAVFPLPLLPSPSAVMADTNVRPTSGLPSPSADGEGLGVGPLPEWAVLLRLAGIAAGQGPAADVAAFDDLVAQQMVEREVAIEGSRVAGRDVDELLTVLAPRHGPERLLDFLLRVGPYGDAFGSNPGGLTLAALEAAPNGIDLGPMQPRIPEVLRTPSGKVELAPEPILADVPRLRITLERTPHAMVLIGRRELRSNNSWMHNLPALMRGPDSCTLLVHPTDAARLGLTDGAQARITSAAGSVEAPVQVTEAIMPGVVSLPHGWGHGQPGTRQSVAQEHAGVSANRLVNDAEVDPLSGNAIQNAVPVTVEPALVAQSLRS